MRAVLVFLFCFFSIVTVAQISVIPKPVKATLAQGQFMLSASTTVQIADAQDQAAADFLNQYLQKVYGFSLKTGNNTGNSIRLSTRKFVQAPENESRYTLTVGPTGVVIEGDSYQGTFYGIQTLIQLLPVQKSVSLTIPAVVIEDQPRFKYRGLHLDAARHFQPVDFVKKYIDYLALHKMNYFHWHLTDDQGWRIEIKKYPRLTEVGAYRNGTLIGRYPGKGYDSLRYGGFYTQDEVKEIVDYAAKRYITVVPEIEMPGHAVAALASYPHLGCTGGPYEVKQTWGVFEEVFCAGNDSVFTFLQDVVDEVIALFPSKYIHIGGDECPKDSWKKCPKCQQRMKDNNLKDEHELQSYFIQRMEKYINGKGRTIIGWDEILEGGLAPNAVVMSWRGEAGGIEAAKQNHDVIMTPGSHVYLDHSQSRNEDSITFGGFTSVQKTYSYDPVPKELNAEQAKHVLGAQGNLWTEYIKNERKVEYQIFPRATALSEVLWSSKENRSWEEFEPRLVHQFKRYELWGANYSKALYDLKSTVVPATSASGIQWQLESVSKEGKIFYGIGDAGQNTAYEKPVIIAKDGKYSATMMVDGKPQSVITQDFYINKATGKKVNLLTPTSRNYPGNGGAFGLINGMKSAKGITSPEWLGWNTGDVEAIIDLGKAQKISSVNFHVLDQNGSWIYSPRKVEALISTDGKTFRAAGNTEAVEKEDIGMGNMRIAFKPVTARYIKVKAYNYGKIPEGRAGAGSTSWLFIDEVQVD